jgi:hypothetical protein
MSKVAVMFTTGSDIGQVSILNESWIAWTKEDMLGIEWRTGKKPWVIYPCKLLYKGIKTIIII